MQRDNHVNALRDYGFGQQAELGGEGHLVVGGVVAGDPAGGYLEDEADGQPRGSR
jgi:hypothetical protein